MRCLLQVLVMSAAASALAAVDFGGFERPAREHRPETWFHLIGGNVAKPGLAADLDAVASAGISGIQLFHGQFGGPWPGVSPQIPCLSRDWDDMIRFAAEGCAARGLSFKMQNCPGWSMSGGPWIAPSNAMRNLTYSRVDVSGGRPVKLELPVPDWQMESRLNAADLDYHDLFVLAFPTPEGDTPGAVEPKPAERTDKDGVLRLVYRFEQPVTFRAVELPSPRQMNHDWAYAPGMTVSIRAGSGGKDVASAEIPQGCWQDFVPFTMVLGAAAPSAEWTVEIAHAHPIKVQFVRFRAGARLHNWEGKAGWVLRGLEGAADVRNRVGPNCCIKDGSVLDLTDKFAAGVLDWTPPEGRWTVLRIGHVNNGARNGPAPKEATGWECDKMDRAGIDAHFAAYIGRLANGPLAGGLLKGFVVDSWECRRQTWTRNLEAEFSAARGYGFRKMLPAVFGWVVGSEERTEAFLRDWRQTLGELVEKNYYARMAELARGFGMTAQYETAFGDVLPGDLMAFWKHCGTPMCEFWFPRAEAGVGQDDFKPIIPCASAAHVYGKRRVAAEACTTTRLKWDEDLKNLKGTINHAFARGVTHLVFHTYTHNPRTDWLPPGSSFGAGIGTPFIRGQAWWKHMPEFTVWVARCEAMLEAGRPVNDVLWYLGESIGHKPSEKSPFPEGYKYDYVNRDALLNRISVKDGLFTTPEGVSWKVLWVPPVSSRWMSDAVKAKLSDLMKCGGRVVYGSAAEVVEGIVPDVTCDGAGPTDWRSGERPVEWLHRQDATADWYFVAANGMDAYSGEVTFRAEGDVSVWDPVTGTRHVLGRQRKADRRTTVRLDLAPAECVFVVFERGKDAASPMGNALQGKGALAASIPLRSWTLSFPSGWGAPAALKLDSLASWTDLPIGEEGRHFSGTAVYRAEFDAKAGDALTLDLGAVETVAEVFVNGCKVRTLWAPPYRCEIGKFVRDGVNDLRVEVTSTWFNRLAYDAGLPESERKTWTIAGPKKGSPPKPAGLLGPVRCNLRVAEFKAGFARVDVTPPLGIPITGYFYKRIADGILDPLYVDCVAVSDGTNNALIYCVDALSLSNPFVKKAFPAITAATGVPRDRIYLHATHTHTGPADWRRKSFTDEENRLVMQYSDMRAAKLADAGRLAIADMAPAQIGAARTICRNVSFIRRYRMKDGSVRTNPGITNPDVKEPLGTPDETVQLVRFRRTGAPDIAIVNFGTHPDTIKGTKFSADWPGVVRRTFESAIGGGVKCMFLNGAQGDVNNHYYQPPPGYAALKAERQTRRNAVALHMGRAVAGAALSIWDVCEVIPSGPVRGLVASHTMPANLPTADELKWVEMFDAGRRKEIPLGSMEIKTLTAPGSRVRRLKNGPDHFDMLVSSLAIGDSLAFAGLPGEPFVDIGRAIKERSPFRMTVVTCLTNGSEGYIPSTKSHADGGYESLSSKFAAPTGDRLVDAQLNQLSALKGNTGGAKPDQKPDAGK